ncbi:TPA: histidine--tRNA ligase [archaeon]|uniref:Histidine--tRNA ligase n=1 Tax=Candidatus Naiadarchaeum limnaeum TaxID=2756139 RepID=A0A832UVF8_9ARCH|nr:histidine--tRNA ligase [Candidatus Naiadarchaeum limnaeum]
MIPRGVRDFPPEEMRKRNFVLDKIAQIYRSYGYREMETPAFEFLDVLTAKKAGGESINKEIFKFEDLGGRWMGLRFDFTVPIARFVAQNPNLPKPFKRFQIGRVWRYEEPQAGRFREFWQADVDVFGSTNVESDLDTLSAVIAALKELGFNDFVVKINSRKLLEEIAATAGVKREFAADFFRVIDKLEKIGEKGVKQELKEKKFPVSENLFKLILQEGAPEKILSQIKKEIKDKKPAEELEDFFKLAKSFGISEYLKLSLSLARGLDYYTGIVFEIKIKGAEKYGSVAGGGRYDNLIALYGKESVPAVGLSIGVERILEIMDEKKMFPNFEGEPKVLVVPIGQTLEKAIELTQKLRSEKISTEIDLMRRNVGKLMNYANTLQIPYVVVIGENELKEKKVTLRDMKTGKQELLNEKDLIKRLK